MALLPDRCAVRSVSTSLRQVASEFSVGFFCRGCRWRIDSDPSGLGRVLWVGANESFRVADIGLVERVLSLLDDLCGRTVMEHLRRQQRDSVVMVFAVISREKSPDKRHVRS